MGLYEELKRQKSEGKALVFADIQESELMELYRHVSDELIGDLYGVTDAEVAEKRRHFGITLRRVALETMLSNPERNRKARERMVDLGTSDVALAISRFVLGSESDTSDDKLIDQIHKRLTYVLELISGEQWQELAFLVDAHYNTVEDHVGTVTPDDGGMRQALMASLLESAASRGNKR